MLAFRNAPFHNTKAAPEEAARYYSLYPVFLFSAFAFCQLPTAHCSLRPCVTPQTHSSVAVLLCVVRSVHVPDCLRD
jgi:hypothetical protein